MTSEVPPQASASQPSGASRTALIISALVVIVWALLTFAAGRQPSTALALCATMAEVAVLSIVIWQVCDPFADAAQWVGHRFRLPGSVRGATLDAVASSLPELFSGIFFVMVALSAVAPTAEGQAVDTQAVLDASAEGYGATIATCAGSAVYNMILIPAFCALVISFARPQRPTIDVDDEVIARDGVWFLSTQILLILFLFQDQMTWWMAISFLLLYTMYIGQLAFDARQFRRRMDFLQTYLAESADATVRQIRDAARTAGLKLSPTMIVRYQDDLSDESHDAEEASSTTDSDDDADSAGIFFGYFDLPLNGTTTVGILAVSTSIVAAACYFLVEATIRTADLLQVPSFFVAVILAAAASSVPDTFLAIAAARRGDDSGAVSNAFGSNIFDICICMSIPLLINSWLTGWNPVSLLQDGQPIPGLFGLRILLVVLTVVNLAVMWHNRQITRQKAIFMCGLYVIFVAYAVLGSMGIVT
ncbi:MAG: hypothetical protein Fues2KO_06970 [Fuerstiella sp.]